MATMARPTQASRDTTESLLSRVPLFSGLSGLELDRIAQVAIERLFPAGSIILREGDPGDTCYVIRSGRARITHEHPDGRALTLTNVGPGEIFGELAMFGGDQRSATVEAMDDVQAVAILAGDLKRLLRKHPEISIKLLEGLAQKLRDSNERIARQSFQKVSSRVAGVLVRLAETERGASVEHPANPGGPEIVIHSTQADLAQLAGSSREATSRFLASLQRAGVVTCRRGRVVVHDPAALKRYIY
jgi:CRP/FNR family transcriptional regulator, cyclic AMP receptor protein